MIDLRRYKNFLIGSLIAIHLAISLPLAYLVNIWADEASSLYTTGSGLTSAIQGAIWNERQAPLYFGILALWRSASDSVFFARILSIVFSLVAIKLFGDFSFRNFKDRPAALATCFFALHPFLLWTSTEIRVYSFVILLSILNILLFESAFTEKSSTEGHKKWEYAFVVLAATFSLYVNYYLGFGLAGCFTVLIIRREWKQSARYFTLMCIVALLSLPLLYVVASQMAVNTTGFQQERSLWDGVRFLWHHVLTFLLPAEIFPDERSSMAAGLRLVIVRTAIFAAIVIAIFRWNRISWRTVTYAIISGVIGILFLISYLLVGENYVAIRHASVLFVPLVLFFASAVSDVFADFPISRALRFSIACTVSAIVIGFFAYSALTLYPDLKKRGDWQQVANFVASRELPNDPILVFTTYDALAFKVYYKGGGTVLPDKNYFDFELEDRFGSPRSMEKRIEFAISQIPAGSDRLWLVESEKCMTTDACVPLENYIEANYNDIEQKDFYRERVRLLTRKTQ